MKKCIFKIRKTDPLTDNITLSDAKGYVDYSTKIGYSRNYDGESTGVWISTDLLSGMSICTGWTKKHCIKNTMDQIYRIDALRNTDKYKKLPKINENIFE